MKKVVKIPISQNKYKETKHQYRLRDSAEVRRKALAREINRKMKMDGITKREAVVKKKGRLNALRIFRKNKRPGTRAYKQCRVLTADMNYLDRKYLKKPGRAKSICGRKTKKTSRV